MKLLSDIVLTGAERFADREAVSDPDRQLTYGELGDVCLRVAGWLTEKGVHPGDRVMIVLPNGIEFLAAHFGVLCAGAVSVPCDPGAPAKTLDHIREHCSPAVVFTNETIAEALSSRRSSTEKPEHQPSDLAAILYTTGTTGTPKGVALTHDNTMTTLRNIGEFIGYTKDDREVVTLPLSHSFGLGHVYSNLMHGGAVHVENGMTRVGRILRKIAEWGATGFPGTPLGFKLLMDNFGPVFAQRCAGLRFMVVNSAPLTPDEAARLQEHLPGCDIMVYYGLTEASRSTFISLTRMGPDYYSSVGRPMPGVDLKLSPSGEILIGGPTVTGGYWSDPALTSQKIENGFLHTGDIGRIDEAGHLFITGRLDEMINIGGFKVTPIEVEAALESHPAIDEACVFGDDAVEAAIVSKSGFDESELVQHLAGQVEPYKVPARFHAVDSIPRTNTGKPKRSALKQSLKGTIDAVG